MIKFCDKTKHVTETKKYYHIYIYVYIYIYTSFNDIFLTLTCIFTFYEYDGEDFPKTKFYICTKFSGYIYHP